MTSSQLVKEGLSRHRESGGHAGQLPYGMTYTEQIDERGHRVVAAVPMELIVLDRMRTLRIGGATYKDIAGHLNAHGHRNRRGQAWTGSNVGRILRRLAQQDEQD
ncbi:MAG: recombinase family protein [Phycisphaerales bacterium]|nr:recombinase family protein [Phycisphaerales bacterium]